MKTILSCFILLLMSFGSLQAKTGGIHLKIKDSANGRPLLRVNLYLLDLATKSHADMDLEIWKDGLYILKDVPCKKYDLQLETANYKNETIKSVVVSKNSITKLESSMEKINEMPVSEPILHPSGKTGSIKGRVITESITKPLARANIYLEGTKYGICTDARGEYELNDIPAGIYTIIISYIGFEKMTIGNFTVEPDSVVSHNFELKPAILK